MDLACMKYAQLQKLAKKHGIKANQKAAVLRCELIKVISVEPLDEPLRSPTTAHGADKTVAEPRSGTDGEPVESDSAAKYQKVGAPISEDDAYVHKPAGKKDSYKIIINDNVDIDNSDTQKVEQEVADNFTECDAGISAHSVRDETKSPAAVNTEKIDTETGVIYADNLLYNQDEQAYEGSRRRKRSGTYELESPSKVDDHDRPQAKKVRRSSMKDLPVIEASPKHDANHSRRSGTYELESPQSSSSSQTDGKQGRRSNRLSDKCDLPVITREESVHTRRSDEIQRESTNNRVSTCAGVTSPLCKATATTNYQTDTPISPAAVASVVTPVTVATVRRSPRLSSNATSVESGLVPHTMPERVTDNDNIVIAPTEGAALTDAVEPTDATKPTDAAEPTDTADADSDEVTDFSQLSKKRSEEGSGLDWMQQLMSQINKAADEKESEIDTKVEEKMATLNPSNSTQKPNSKTPNFKKLHEKNFSRMTDITAVHARRMKYISTNPGAAAYKAPAARILIGVVPTKPSNTKSPKPTIRSTTGIPTRTPTSKLTVLKNRTPITQAKPAVKPKTPTSSVISTQKPGSERKAVPSSTTPHQAERIRPRIVKPIRGGGGGNTANKVSAIRPAAIPTSLGNPVTKPSTKPTQKSMTAGVASSSKTPPRLAETRLFSPTLSTLKKCKIGGSPAPASPRLSSAQKRSQAFTTGTFTVGAVPNKIKAEATLKTRQPLKVQNKTSFDLKASLKTKPSWKAHKGPLVGHSATNSNVRRINTIQENREKRRQLAMSNRAIKR